MTKLKSLATKGMVIGLAALMSNAALAANHHGEWIGGFGIPTEGMGTIFNSDAGVANGVFGQGGMALGDGGVLTSGWNSIAMGQGSVVGNLSEADFKKYTDLIYVANGRGDGDYSQATNFVKSKVQNSNDDQQANSVALGVNNLANGSGSFILGRYNKAISTGVDLDAGFANNYILGARNVLNSNNSSIIGTNNRISGATHVVVLGNNIQIKGTQYSNDVVLGNNAAAAKAVKVEKTFAAAKPYATLSIGAKGKERQIKNVAAGQVSASSTDAVNGSQLYYTVQALKKEVALLKQEIKALKNK